MCTFKTDVAINKTQYWFIQHWYVDFNCSNIYKLEITLLQLFKFMMSNFQMVDSKFPSQLKGIVPNCTLFTWAFFLLFPPFLFSFQTSWMIKYKSFQLLTQHTSFLDVLSRYQKRWEVVLKFRGEVTVSHSFKMTVLTEGFRWRWW